jgi:predicted O-methyltransferase YrrM
MDINGIECTIAKNGSGYFPPLNGRVGALCISPQYINFFIHAMESRTNYLEVGTFDGISLSILAETFPQKSFYAVDAFKEGFGTGNGHIEFFIDNCSRYSNIHLYKGTSQDILPTLDKKYDFIFIDGDHSYEIVKFDFEQALRLIEKGGIIAFDDYVMPGVAKAINEVCGNNGLILQCTDIIFIQF